MTIPNVTTTAMMIVLLFLPLSALVVDVLDVSLFWVARRVDV